MYNFTIFVALLICLFSGPTTASISKESRPNEYEFWGTVPEILDEKDLSLRALVLLRKPNDSPKKPINTALAILKKILEYDSNLLTSVLVKTDLARAFLSVPSDEFDDSPEIAVNTIPKEISDNEYGPESQSSVSTMGYDSSEEIAVDTTEAESSEDQNDAELPRYGSEMDPRFPGTREESSQLKNAVDTETSARYTHQRTSREVLDEHDSDDEDSDDEDSEEDYDEDDSIRDEIYFGSSPQIKKLQQIPKYLPQIVRTKKCFSSPHEDRWCFDGNCELHSFHDVMRDSDIPWKPRYPLAGKVRCRGEFSYYFWNFGIPLGVAFFFIDDAFTIPFDMHETLRRILPIRRDDVIEWHLHGGKQWSEREIRRYRMTGVYPRGGVPQCMIMIGNEDADSFTVKWTNGNDRLALNLDKSGKLLHKWYFGSSIIVGMASTLDGDVVYEKWEIDNKIFTIFTAKGKKTFTGERPQIETVRQIKRSIGRWCDENSRWVMAPFDPYIMAKSEVDSS